MRVGSFRHVVVIDDDGMVVGVVSHRDIFFNALAWSLGQGRVGHDEALASVAVKDAMRSGVVSVRPTQPLGEVGARGRLAAWRTRRAAGPAIPDGARRWRVSRSSTSRGCSPGR